MSKRACENWLNTFLDWTKPVSEAPESLLIWSGLFCISAVLKRRVRFSREYTKQYNIYPNTYVIFVGPPGVVRKSTSAGYSQQIIERMNKLLTVASSAYVNLGPTSGSEVKIIEKMSESVDGAMTIISGEFHNLVATRPDETYAFLTKMFDGDATAKKYLHSTRGHGDELIVNPCLNLLGCTTPDWVAQNSGYMLGGGFAARTVFVFEDKARQRRLFYKNVGPSVKDLERMERQLIKDLARIGTIKGEFVPENDELADEMEKWYQEYMEAPTERGTETFQARKHVHTIRTAMTLALCESNELVIKKKHFEGAKVLINDVESKLSRGLSVIGRNPISDMYYTVLEYIKKNAPAPVGAAKAYFWSDMTPDQFSQVIEVLKVSGQIVEDLTAKTYKLPSK